MALKLGKLVQVHSASALVPENEDVWIEFEVFGWPIKLQFVFEKDEEDKNKRRWIFTGKDDYAVFILTNWSSSLGASINEPFEFGRDEERPVYVMFSACGIGKVTRLEAQFYVEAKDHE